MPWYWTTKFLGFMTGDYESCEKVLFTISRHQVFGAVAGDCSSFEQAFGNISAKIRQQHQIFFWRYCPGLFRLDNWRFILLLRLGIYFFSKFLKMNSRVSSWSVEAWLAVKPCLNSFGLRLLLHMLELCMLKLGWPLAMSSVLDRSFLWKLGWLWSHV